MSLSAQDLCKRKKRNVDCKLFSRIQEIRSKKFTVLGISCSTTESTTQDALLVPAGQSIMCKFVFVFNGGGIQPQRSPDKGVRSKPSMTCANYCGIFSNVIKIVFVFKTSFFKIDILLKYVQSYFSYFIYNTQHHWVF